MAGHSKWAQIKRQKGINDVKRGALFTRIGNQIAIAARSGTDPLTNPALAMAIETAKQANMPLSNIERAIQRVADKSAAALEEVLYEGYGPGGVAVIVECATDNRNRTYPEVRNAFNKHGGNIAEPGAVAFQFSRKGMIRIKASGDDAMLAVLDAGAEDVFEENSEMVVYTDPKQLAAVRSNLNDRKFEIVESSLIYEPNNSIEIQDADAEAKVMRLMEAIEDLDDVLNTYTNLA